MISLCVLWSSAVRSFGRGRAREARPCLLPVTGRATTVPGPSTETAESAESGRWSQMISLCVLCELCGSEFRARIRLAVGFRLRAPHFAVTSRRDESDAGAGLTVHHAIAASGNGCGSHVPRDQLVDRRQLLRRQPDAAAAAFSARRERLRCRDRHDVRPARGPTQRELRRVQPLSAASRSTRATSSRLRSRLPPSKRGLARRQSSRRGRRGCGCAGQEAAAERV